MSEHLALSTWAAAGEVCLSFHAAIEASCRASSNHSSATPADDPLEFGKRHVGTDMAAARRQPMMLALPARTADGARLRARALTAPLCHTTFESCRWTTRSTPFAGCQQLDTIDWRRAHNLAGARQRLDRHGARNTRPANLSFCRRRVTCRHAPRTEPFRFEGREARGARGLQWRPRPRLLISEVELSVPGAGDCFFPRL